MFVEQPGSAKDPFVWLPPLSKLINGMHVGKTILAETSEILIFAISSVLEGNFLGGKVTH